MLARENCPQAQIYFFDIAKKIVSKSDVIFGHGVLEHFSDEECVKIVSQQRENARVKVVHYVPLDKYVTPSFGDERLLPAFHWVSLLSPTRVWVENDGYDLFMEWDCEKV